MYYVMTTWPQFLLDTSLCKSFGHWATTMALSFLFLVIWFSTQLENKRLNPLNLCWIKDNSARKMGIIVCAKCYYRLTDRASEWKDCIPMHVLYCDYCLLKKPLNSLIMMLSIQGNWKPGGFWFRFNQPIPMHGWTCKDIQIIPFTQQKIVLFACSNR